MMKRTFIITKNKDLKMSLNDESYINYMLTYNEKHWDIVIKLF